MKIKKTWEDIIMDTVIGVALIIFALACLYPIWFVLMASFSDSTSVVMSRGLLLWPKNFSLKAYQLVFQNKLFSTGFLNSIKLLAMSLPINLTLTVMCGYFLACNGMMFKKPIAYMIMFTMYFSGGMIPQYLNVKELGLYNTHWAIVLTGALSVYNCFICRTAIQSIPDGLRESAYLDGANDLQILFKVIIPLIKPTLAVLAMYYGVGTWNGWFKASIYLKENAMVPIQNVLRSVLIMGQDAGVEGAYVNEYAETIKYAAIVVSTVPVLCVYPFLQKYFTKGVLVGAVKE
jgi:putative aldouronate transport system permease protein